MRLVRSVWSTAPFPSICPEGMKTRWESGKGSLRQCSVVEHGHTTFLDGVDLLMNAHSYADVSCPLTGLIASPLYGTVLFFSLLPHLALKGVHKEHLRYKTFKTLHLRLTDGLSSIPNPRES